MIREINFHYQFQAVGQGLFSFGNLWDVERNRHFDWVFDCGTLSGKAYRTREIDNYKSGLGQRPIGLFCISHFDEDHINGVKELLKGRRVQTLVMPYVSLLNRMLMAAAKPGISLDHLNFLADPAAYITGSAGDTVIEQIVYVLGGAPPENEEGAVPPPEGGGPDTSWELQLPPGVPLSVEMSETSDLSYLPKLKAIGHRNTFVMGGVWEFVFYNLNIPNSQAAKLGKSVAAIIEANRKHGIFKDSAWLKEIKALYDKELGASGEQRNMISLVTYAGPVPNRHSDISRIQGGLVPVSWRRPFWHRWHPWYPWRYYEAFFRWHYGYRRTGWYDQISIIYFGDFPLTNMNILAPLRRYLGGKRWQQINVLQVPHHGSRHSWFTGAAAQFSHAASVFSSRRFSLKHPARSVLKDLKQHGPLRVNEKNLAVFYGVFCIR